MFRYDREQMLADSGRQLPAWELRVGDVIKIEETKIKITEVGDYTLGVTLDQAGEPVNPAVIPHDRVYPLIVDSTKAS